MSTLEFGAHFPEPVKYLGILSFQAMTLIKVVVQKRKDIGKQPEEELDRALNTWVFLTSAPKTEPVVKGKI